VAACSALNAIDLAALEGDDDGLVAELLASAAAAVRTLETLAGAAWRAKLAPSEN
jgi:hypothetical protein